QPPHSPRHLHSFPTRRSSDLGLRGGNHEVNVLGIQNLVTGGDVIVAIDGIPVHRADDVVRVVSSSLNPNDVAVFTIVRDGHSKKDRKSTRLNSSHVAISYAVF